MPKQQVSQLQKGSQGAAVSGTAALYCESTTPTSRKEVLRTECCLRNPRKRGLFCLDSRLSSLQQDPQLCRLLSQLYVCSRVVFANWKFDFQYVHELHYLKHPCHDDEVALGTLVLGKACTETPTRPEDEIDRVYTPVPLVIYRTSRRSRACRV